MIMIHGKRVKIPRRQVAFGDPGTTYSFSGTTVGPKEWTPLLRRLKRDVEAETKEAFNFVLINRYKDGKDRIGAHRDDEKGIDRGAPIAGLSFGATRDFVLKHGSAHNKNWVH